MTMDFQQAFVDDFLLGDIVLLEFQVKPILVEYLGQLPRGFQGPVKITLEKIMGDLSMQASGHGDQAFVMFPQQLPVDPGLVVKTFKIGLGD